MHAGAWLSIMGILRRRRGSNTPLPTGTLRTLGSVPPELRMECGLATDTGCVRTINEDAIRIIRPTDAERLAEQGVLAVVCDGMGGHEAGEIASHLAIETVVKRFEEGGRDAEQMLVRAVQAANRAIHDSAASNVALKGMGTTCTALLLRDGLAYCAHVGDSRLYLVRDAQIFLMTEDHSAVMELVRQGAISREEARHHPEKNVISRALGGHRDVEVTTWPQPFAVAPGDRFLLCSDGLYDLVEESEILDAVRDFSAQEACERLVELARAQGGHDNISVAVLAMARQEEQKPTDVRETRTLELPQ